MIALTLAALIAQASPSPAPSTDVATLVWSASTNTPRTTLTVHPDGSVTVSSVRGSREVHVNPQQALQLFTDLQSAGDLDAMPAGHCMKSVSFGTTTTIAYHGRTTPDLQCAQNLVEHALFADADAIYGSCEMHAQPSSD